MVSAPEASSGGTDPSAGPARLTSAKRFGRYRLCYELASGGMGTVYLARAEGPAGFEKLVALKRIHEHLAKDERFVAMFLDEARIAAQVQHPNVCSVIDFGQVDGAYYLTMPFVSGESLHRVLRAVRKRDDEGFRERFLYAAVRILADACEGLHAAHELRDPAGEPLDVVHRDVSPQNLLIGYDGGARVLDFGVASARHRLHSTATGEVKGKFAYLPPEQIEGQPVDRRADVWALGVVLYECAALRRLFSRKTMAETIQAVLAGPIPALSEVAPHAPLALEEIVFKALARDPSRRYATAREMGRELLAWLAEEGRAVGSAEVAELMLELFPDGEIEKRAMVEAARADDESAPGAQTAATVTGTRHATTREARGGAPWLLMGGIALGAVAAGIGGTLYWTEGRATEPPIASEPIEERVSERVAEPPREPTEPPAPAEAPMEEPAVVTPPPEEREVVEAPSREPAEERPRGRGTVTIVTPGGWALVYRGSARLGEAPGTFALPAGAHVLGIQPMGRGPIQRRRVRVSPGATTRVSIPVQ